MDEIPRRNRIDLMTPAELAITNAMEAVEEAGCDTRLTEAVILLGEAREKVADFVDGKENPKVTPKAEPKPTGKRIDISGRWDDANDIEYLGDAFEMDNGTWRALAAVSGMLCLVEVTITEEKTNG